MERRHHYPSGLMRLSHCRKGQAITAGAVFSLETRRGWRDEAKIDSTHREAHSHTRTNKQTRWKAASFFLPHPSSLFDFKTLT